jgi:O-antigen/teichoic acid export membrane protein
MKVLLPLASQLSAQNDQGRLRALYLTSTRLTLAIFVPLACGIVMLAPPFLTVWVGAFYADYAYLVVILTTASLINTSQWPIGSILQGMARHRWLALLSLGSGLTNLVLSIFLIRYIGVAGAALGTLIPTCIECILILLPYAMRMNRVSLGVALGEMFLPTLVPAIPMSIILYVLQGVWPLNSFVSIGLVGGMGLVVYGATYFLMSANTFERRTLDFFVRDSLRFIRARFRPA